MAVLRGGSGGGVPQDRATLGAAAPQDQAGIWGAEPPEKDLGPLGPLSLVPRCTRVPSTPRVYSGPGHAACVPPPGLAALQFFEARCLPVAGSR